MTRTLYRTSHLRTRGLQRLARGACEGLMATPGQTSEARGILLQVVMLPLPASRTSVHGPGWGRRDMVLTVRLVHHNRWLPLHQQPQELPHGAIPLPPPSIAAARRPAPPAQACAPHAWSGWASRFEESACC